MMVKVNYSPENENEEVLSRYPEVAGYPHFFVLDGQGKLLHSQDTAELEKGKSYHARRFKRFLTRWGPRGSGPPGRRDFPGYREALQKDSRLSEPLDTPGQANRPDQRR